MKKILLPIFALVFAVIQFSCSSKEVAMVKQISSNFPIILILARDTNMIATVRFPLVFEMSANPFKNINLSNSIYWHNSHFSKKDYWGGATLYKSDKGNLCYSDKLETLGFAKKEFVVYTSHSCSYKMDEKFVINLQPYAQKMIKEKKDTLHISSIQELKKTHPEIINAFLEGDSILFRFYNDETIITRTFPVEVK